MAGREGSDDLRSKLSLLAPGAVVHTDGLLEAFARYGIDTPERQAMFLAQCAHESGGFRVTQENLNYTAEALRKIFGKYFPTVDLAAAYHRQPERIANRVYGGRMGNDGEESGDGWKFRGRGLTQLTGRTNYLAFSLAHFGDRRLVDGDPSVVAELPLAALSAGWFWKTRKLNEPADRGDLERCTRLINGGLHGLEDRARWWAKAKEILRG